MLHTSFKYEKKFTCCSLVVVDQFLTYTEAFEGLNSVDKSLIDAVTVIRPSSVGG